MSLQSPTSSALIGRFSNPSQIDLLQVATNGGLVTVMDANGNVPGSAVNVPATKTLYVDGNRTDSYTQIGSVTQPFKTIMGAVNQIVTNGDNGPAVPYEIYVASGVYTESIDLSNSKLTNVSFFGGYGTIVGIAYNGIQVLSAPLVNIVNNDNLISAIFVGFNFISGAINHGMVFSSTTNNTLFGSGNIFGIGGIQFFNCLISTPDILINNCGQVTFANCLIQVTNINCTNCITLGLFAGCQLVQGDNVNVFTTATPAPSGFAATQAQFQSVISLAAFAIDAGSSMVGYVSRLRGPITVNGIFTNRGSAISGNITVNNGGRYTEDSGGGHSGSLTLNGSGVYTQTGTYGIGTMFLNGVQFSSGTGSPQSVVTGNPGDMYLNKSGGAGTTLWVKESGTATNTGWVGK